MYFHLFLERFRPSFGLSLILLTHTTSQPASLMAAPCAPDPVVYLTKEAAQQRTRLARDKMKEHNLQGWTLKITRAKTQAGVCDYAAKVIGISNAYLWSSKTTEANFLDTVLHEIAHALVGPGINHGPVWRSMALSIGCTGKRCVSAFTERRKVAACACGAYTVKRHVLTKALLFKKCKKCGTCLKRVRTRV